jgi:hypothetical protein
MYICGIGSIFPLLLRSLTAVENSPDFLSKNSLLSPTVKLFQQLTTL